jgi:hypothetical protein
MEPISEEFSGNKSIITCYNRSQKKTDLIVISALLSESSNESIRKGSPVL